MPKNKSFLIIPIVLLLGLVGLCCIAVLLYWYFTNPTPVKEDTIPAKIPITQTASAFTNSRTQSATPGKIAGQDACLSGIYPGKTTRDEVTSLLGTPITIDESNGSAALYYPSPLVNQNNMVFLENGVVSPW